MVKRWQEKAAAHPSFLSDAQAGTNSKNNNNFMRKSPQYFLSRFLDTGLPLFNIYFKFSCPEVLAECGCVTTDCRMDVYYDER